MTPAEAEDVDAIQCRFQFCMTPVQDQSPDGLEGKFSTPYCIDCLIEGKAGNLFQDMMTGILPSGGDEEGSPRGEKGVEGRQAEITIASERRSLNTKWNPSSTDP